jgi:hypothetical protein
MKSYIFCGTFTPYNQIIISEEQLCISNRGGRSAYEFR